MTSSNSLRFPASERLKLRTILDALFQDKNHLFGYPLRVHYQFNAVTQGGVQVAFTVSKRKFKHAVDRNRVRRRMKEAWRLQREPLLILCKERGVKLDLILIFSGNIQDTDYAAIAKGARKVVRLLGQTISDRVNLS